ncbi:MAG: hypothetical protein HGA75_11785 [Thiobacillus sp.]|nr:hypothetical protein [Thiobacillus sp.]
MKVNKLAVALAAAGFASGAYATNGMNVEGYGPIAAGMGGASFAYDNGNAAMMNNPATLGLAADGSRLDIAVGYLGPDVQLSMGGGPKSSSGGDAYFMPAIGWSKKNGALTYGLGMFAQGGMGTEWDDTVFKNFYSPDGLAQRSELGVGRLIAPLAYQVNPNLTIGGSIDFVWAMLDMKMALPSMYFNPAPNGLITGCSGPMCGLAIDQDAGGYGRLEFSDGSDFTGKAKGYGMAGKLGFTYKLNPTMTLGATYHSKTSLGDMKTSANGASFTATIDDGVADNIDPNYIMSMPGKLTVRDFQWPETYGLGISVQATPSLMIAADFKRIAWAEVMENFKMTYSNAMGSMSFALPQNWDDQNVFQLGVAYQATPALTLRAGASVSDNPIPDSTMNFLFPAIVKNHYTLGFGYAFNPASDLNFSVQFAPEVKQTNPNMQATVSHSQTSWQLMYSNKF